MPSKNLTDTKLAITELKKMNGRDALKQGRRLLSDVAVAAQRGKENEGEGSGTETGTGDTNPVEGGLSACLTMAESFHANTTSMELSTGECAVVRGIIELIVRWGISPYLSPEVGITRQRTSREKQVQQAISHHFLSNPCPSLEDMDGEGVLLSCCNLLASFAMDNLPHKGFCVSVLVRNYYLVDIMAGFLQVAFGPSSKDEERRKIAVYKIEGALDTLDVGNMVETFLALVGQRKRNASTWLTSEAGKILSRLVMRDGGVLAVMQRLLGPGVKGDVQVYNNVAAHLAKVPKYVANAEEYYHAVCAQILPFLPYQRFAKKHSGEGETAQQILLNMHHTSVLLACTMIAREPELSETYLLKPILAHLVKWYKLQTQRSNSENCCNEGKGQELTETVIIQSLMQLHALSTAGHKDANKVGKLVLEKSRLAIPALMMLHYLLETSPTSKPFWAVEKPAETGLGPDKVKQTDKKGYNEDEEITNRDVKQRNASFNAKRDKSTGFRKGFLDGYVSQTSDEDGDLSAVGRLKVVVTDLMIAHVCEMPEDLTHLMLSFLCVLDVKEFTWPSTEGDIWKALDPSNSRSHTPSEYLSRLLLACEKWSMTMRLMGDILRNLFNLHQSLKLQLFNKENNGETSQLPTVLLMMQSFETLNEVVGSKAMEHDSVAASALIQDLLNQSTLLNDEDMVELVLHMVHNVLNGFSSRFSEEGLDNQGKEVLICMSASLERICSSESLTQKVKNMSSTLNTRICSLVAS